MAKFWFMSLALMFGVSLASAPLAAQDEASEEAPAEEAPAGESVASTSNASTSVGYGDGGLSFSTEDDAFSMRVSTRVQFRMTYSDENGSGERGGTDARDFWTFALPRVETTFQGHIFAKEWKYKLTLNWAETPDIKTATLTWAGDKFYNVTIGQQKLQFNWQELNSSASQMMVERSVYNETFNLDYAKGITVDGEYADDSATWVKYWAGIYNGVLRSNTDFRNADRAAIGNSFAGNGQVDADLMFNLRLETYPLGEFTREGRDARGADEKENPLFMVGLAFNYFGSDMSNTGLRPGNTAAASGRFQGRHSTMAITIDAHLRWFGINFDAEFTYRKAEFSNSGALNTSGQVGGAAVPTDLEDMGFVIEAGYMLSEDMQIGLRYGYVNGDEFTVGGTTGGSGGTTGNAFIHDSSEVGLVFNYFLHGDSLKATVDITYVDFQLATGAGTGANAAGPTNIVMTRSASSRANEVADHQNVWQFRVQIQWIF
ncbi:MAG: OprO/OprP family phosphate-selective porin [Planctomycetes bacterium]|nr:OprO/OprP family phosphate-selective porin [Planctomycetota bacterium]